ncbi:MAG: M90 family metallopeptidase [Woeseia sp.]
MIAILYLALLFALLLLAIALFWMLPPRLRRARRARQYTKPFPRAHEELLQRNVPLYRLMPRPLQAELRGRINVFLSEKSFVGCGGLLMTDEIRITVAAYACMLILNRSSDYFPGFSSILVYPGAYLVDEVVYDGEVEIQGQDARVGESWHRGPVVLSWEDVQDTLSELHDGTNVVLHEFAHKLDEENGDIDGVPQLADSAHYREWAQVLTQAFEAAGTGEAGGDPHVLDVYAFTAPEEFFAVATEGFFGNPALMKKQLPELYQQLQRFYCVDPASWTVPVTYSGRERRRS